MHYKKLLFTSPSYFILSLLVLLINIGLGQANGLPMVIDNTNCARYKDLLIPAMYRAVERGDFVITPGKINFKYKLPDSFLAASKKNAGKFDVTPNGDLVDKRTGKYPENIYGLAFPNIDPKDPKAGEKIIYNFEFQMFRFMGETIKGHVIWINKKGEERYILSVDNRLYMNGRPPGKKIKNPDKVLRYEFQNTMEPMSVKGLNTMSYIYEDTREDSNYAYVPAIRRVRQTSSTARSDPYVGSDGWLDTYRLWSGKNRSMQWKYVGEKTILVSFTSPDMIPVEELPDGRIAMRYPYTGRCFKLNYEVPGFKGASWAPAPGVITYIPRKVWIVEQMPKDPYYSWGLHINYIDQETYTIWYKEVYERSGNFRTWIINFMHNSEASTGNNTIGVSDAALYIDENVQHATMVAAYPDHENYICIPASQMGPSFFFLNNFLLLSK